MVSDSELINRLQEILKSSDLDKTSAASVRRQLEGEYGVSLNDRKKFISEQIDGFLATHFSQSKNGNDQTAPAEQYEEEEKIGSDNAKKEVESIEMEEEGNDNNGAQEKEAEEEEGSDEEINLKKNRKSDKVDKIVKRKGGFSKPSALSPQLQELVGVPELARTEVVKKIWAYIREKNLQNPDNRKKINCDKILRAIFQVDTVDMFKMNKLLSKHIWPIEMEEVTLVKSPKMERQRKQARQEGKDEPKVKEKRQKGQKSGFFAPFPISDALMNFFGTGEDSLSRSEVVKRMWQYIKENELQDPTDKRRILCDDKLKELFEVDSFIGFSMTKLLTAHFVKAD